MTAPVFADASALVKLYADEESADQVRSIATLVVSELSRVEVPDALWRKCRTGDIDAEDAALLVSEFEADYFGTAESRGRFAIVALTPETLDDAARLAGVHGLRAYDAVQLAGALAALAAEVPSLQFVAFDVQLRRAAAAEGLQLLAIHPG